MTAGVDSSGPGLPTGEAEGWALLHLCHMALGQHSTSAQHLDLSSTEVVGMQDRLEGLDDHGPFECHFLKSF